MSATRNAWTNPMLLAWMAVGLYGCGGGGPAASETPPPVVVETRTLTARYAPLAVGNAWFWRYNDGPSPGTTYTEQVVAQVALADGTSGWRVDGEDFQTSYYSVDSTGLVLKTGPRSTPFIAAVAPLIQLRFGQRVGETDVAERRLATDLDGDGVPDPGTFRMETTLAGFETASTGLANYPDSARLLIKVTMQVQWSASGRTTLTETTAHSWWAPDIGEVRRIENTFLNGSAQPRIDLAVLSWQVGGRRSP